MTTERVPFAATKGEVEAVVAAQAALASLATAARCSQSLLAAIEQADRRMGRFTGVVMLCRGVVAGIATEGPLDAGAMAPLPPCLVWATCFGAHVIDRAAEPALQVLIAELLAATEAASEAHQEAVARAAKAT